MAEQEDVARIPLVEERIAIGKRDVETGRIRVHVAVDEREEQVSASLAHDAVEIVRVKKNEALSALPAVRIDGDVTIIPVVEEQLVVEKRLMLVEEIHVVRTSETRDATIPVAVRAERAEIEREEAAEGAA
jgi:uncharacterized protein (TIGR02271 family)